jgi:NTE family protein
LPIDHPGRLDSQRDAHVPAVSNANSARSAFVPVIVPRARSTIRVARGIFHVARMLAVAGLAAAFSLSAQGQAAPPSTAPEAAPKPRPKIGLVLSGGGARGITHIGVLKVLEQLRIPVDYIAATSMGAIVGGLYASGMSPAEMEKQITTVSWPTLLSDSPPRRDMGFRNKEEDAQFPFAFEIGFRDWQFRTFKGALSGSNLESFLHELTRSVENVATFDQLPIPFRAIATDMVSGREVVFDRGPIYQAMRASMSVPGMFTPAEIDGRILGDGGLVNNLPVDVVRAMGADIVIAVNIGTPLMSRDQLSSMLGYTAQTINILTEQNVRAQLALLRPGDILISPDLGELTFVDFGKSAQFIALGEKAAESAREKLAALSESATTYIAFQASLLVPLETTPKTLDFIRIEGTHFANPQVLEDQMQTQVGKPFSLPVLEKDLSRLYGRGDFEQIDYRLMQEQNQHGLVIDVTEKSWGPNYLRFGLALNTDLQGDTAFDLLVGHKRTWINSLGAEWINEVGLGTVNRYATEFYQPLTLGNFVFASAHGSIQRGPEYVFQGNQRLAEYSVLTETAGLDVGTPLSTFGEIRVGYLWTHQRGNPTIAVPGFPSAVSTESGARVLLRWDGLDNPYFPRKGMKFIGEVFMGSNHQSAPGIADYTSTGQRGTLYANAGISATPDDFFNVAVRGGAIHRERTDIINNLTLGGFLNLSGLRTDQLDGRYLALGRAVYYHQIGSLPIIGRGIFAGASLEAGNVWQQRNDVSASGLITAGSVFLAADTWLGPFYFAYGRASGGQSSFYLYLGRP